MRELEKKRAQKEQERDKWYQERKQEEDERREREREARLKRQAEFEAAQKKLLKEQEVFLRKVIMDLCSYLISHDPGSLHLWLKCGLPVLERVWESYIKHENYLGPWADQGYIVSLK